MDEQTNELYINILRNNLDKIIWENLSGNPMAIELLTENQDKINWENLSMNTAAIELLTDNQDKINWMTLSMNTAAIELLTANQDKINWAGFSGCLFHKFQTKKKDDPNLTLNNRLLELELKNNLLQLRLDNAEQKTKQLRIEFLMLMMCMAVIIIKFIF